MTTKPDMSREAVEQLAAQLVFDCEQFVHAPIFLEAAATLRALLAAKEAAEAERDALIAQARAEGRWEGLEAAADLSDDRASGWADDEDMDGYDAAAKIISADLRALIDKDKT